MGPYFDFEVLDRVIQRRHGKMDATGERTTEDGTAWTGQSKKSANDVFAQTQLKGFIRTHGVKHLVFKSDQERALVALLEAVAADLRRDGITIIWKQSPVGESQSNGVAERQIQSVEDLLRTMRGALVHRLQCSITQCIPFSNG